MPELAEVEFYRRRWSRGVGAAITRVHAHATRRVFAGGDVENFAQKLVGKRMLGSDAHGKRMVFRFSGDLWLGLHLGMTGELLVELPEFTPTKHDHLVLFQRERALVFRDPRLFGRVLLFRGKGEPPWWAELPPQVTSSGFTLARMRERLARHRKLPLKAALLDQSNFPGIGNWMADEILWQTRIHPRIAAGSLAENQVRDLWRVTRSVSRRAIDTVAKQTGKADFGDPPRDWLFHVRWSRNGKCPRDGTLLKRETIGGRTTAWCPKCQRASRG